MGVRFRLRLSLWWQQNRGVIGAIAIFLVIVIALIIIGYSISGAGFNGYNIITISKTTSGIAPPTTTRTTVYQPGKTLWDWLQLLVVPIMLAIGAFWLNRLQKRREERTTLQQSELERELTNDSQQETALQQYIDKMSELLLKEHLGELKPEYEGVRMIARVRTLTLLPRLDSNRKRSVLQFLQESGLIYKNKSIVDLSGADLSKIYLRGAKLINVDLSGANLKGTNLIEADLTGIDLSGAVLWGADLLGTNLTDANLRKASISLSYYVGAEPNNTDLGGANLTNADLSSADLRGANLTRTNLTGTDLADANLLGAEVTSEQLAKAKSLKGATMPDGSIHP